MIKDLYSIQLLPEPQTPLPSEDEEQADSSSVYQLEQHSYAEHGMYNSVQGLPLDALVEGQGSTAASSKGMLANFVEEVVEVEPGILVTFRYMPDGEKELFRLEIREEHCNRSAVQKWWEENWETIKDLYSNKLPPESQTPLPSEDEEQTDSIPANQQEQHSYAQHDMCNSVQELPHDAPVEGEGSTTASSRTVQSNFVEEVVEDEPGISITFRSTPDGVKELVRVDLSRKKFGLVKARVWWLENEERILDVLKPMKAVAPAAASTSDCCSPVTRLTFSNVTANQ